MCSISDLQCTKLGRPFDGKINAWDVKYYSDQVEKKEYCIDQDQYKVYFPMEKVTQGENLMSDDFLCSVL